ncbi:transporter substrate-binding domain-containing protein [Paraburkholderia sp. D15]|uniref:ATP-binding protein n=1 Tax=Paraburkholderia sp. D15 TaxID=2880218 RepID=UPI002478F6F5|nr:transporter substrate-binding domain-containing protein [Paraburkholderia sp. D15]WGS50364.1 transporter substrate-binding domain-containing protein [Paraburkholderia sp. D15]
MRRVFRRLSLCLLALFFLCVGQEPGFAQASGDVARAEGTREVPAKLVVGVLAGGWLPFESLQDGALSGMSIDYLRALLGPDTRIEAQTFPDLPHLLAAACAGQVDLVTSIARTPERERCLKFTAPYFRSSVSAVVRRDGETYTTSTQLRATRIAVEKSFALERLLRERFPRARFQTFANTRAALDAVVLGHADVYLGFTPTVRHALATEDFRALHVAFEEASKTSELRFGVPPGQIALRDRLNRALASLDPAHDAALRARWLSGNFDAQPVPGVPSLLLTPQEKSWLASLPPLPVGFDSGWPPFSYVDDAGRPSGVAADYLSYLSRTLGIVFTRAPIGNWPATIEAFQRGELALVATASSGDPRLKDARFSQPYESYPLVIVGRDDEPVARSPGDFAARRIVVPSHIAGAAPHALEGIEPGHIAITPSLDDALAMVAANEADVLIGNVAAVDIALKRRYDNVLKILGMAGDADALSFAVRADLSPLDQLIDRALRAMPLAERQRIRQKWINGREPETGTWSVTALRLLPLLIGIGVVLLVTLRACLLLQHEVRLRRKIERDLALQLSFQETMMKMVPYPLVAKDFDGRYIAVNQAYEEACGLPREAVIGRTATEVQCWGEANSRILDRMTREMLKGGETAQAELQFERKDGDLRHGLFWTSSCRDSDGKPVCVLGTMVDITDIRRAEMLARETERRLFDVTRSLPAVVFQLRRTADGVYSFPYIGGDTRHLPGGVGAANPGKVDFRRVCEQDRGFVIAELEHSARCETPVHLEFRFKGDGGLSWVRAELVPRREAAGSVVWSGFWVDASVERARSEELARARDVAEAASRAKDDFFAMMSHEIRTPMNGVLGLVEVLERTPLNADQSEMLSMIHESAGALLQILDDLLDYSKIDAGRLTIEAEPIDIRELVDNAVGLLAGRAHEKGLKVRVDIAPQVAALVRGDSVRFRQILFNLLGNAIKFTPAGEVDVRVSVVAQTDGAQTLEMTVADTGIGIAPDVQAKLFEPFVQAESSTTRRFGGTGLGLTICRKLIELMEGSLALQSEPGCGTRMTVRLGMPVEALHYSVSALRGKRAVVVTGDVRVARALMHFGKALGLELRHVAPGSDELGDRLMFARLDLLFATEDVRLPEGVLPASRIVCLTEKPKPTGYRIIDDKVRVSVNPISWRGLGAACAAALTGLPTVAPRLAGMRSAEGGAVPPDRERAIASGRLILVAEDHPVNQELIRHQLALLGFACDVANDGAEALAALEHTRYGCLITDCHMPNLSGYELTRRIRAKEASGEHRLPILGITANTAPEDLNLCREAGMDDSLVKPTRLATLRDYLSRWFGASVGTSAGVGSGIGSGSINSGGTDSAAHDSPAEATSASIPAVQPSTGSAQQGSEPFTPVDLSYMTQLWGSESTVKALLDSFVSSVREDMAALAPLLEQKQTERVREWLHRVAGAASVLQYSPLFKALEAYRRDISGMSPEQVRVDGLALISTCNAMLDGIEQQAALLS